MAKTFNLFISHSWSYSDAYEKFCNLLNNASNFSYKNYSVPKDDPIHNAPTSQALYNAIRTQMAYCHVVIIMAGKYATYSDWINKEIKCATQDLRKPILGVKPWANTQVSSVVNDNADLLVGWNTSTIVDGIRQISL